MSENSSVFNAMTPKQTFIFGAVAGVLVLCTLGFFILLNQFLKGGVSTATAGNNARVAAAPAPLPTPPDNAMGGHGGGGNVTVPQITADDHVKGSDNAEVTLVEYSDFECPFCGRFFPTIQQVEQEYGDRVRIVYRHFPLSFHPEATPAAEASECAAEQGAFWEFHDYLFENQPRMGSALYTEAAGNFGLNMGQFNDCVSSGKYRQKVIDQQNGGSLAGVGGTPHTIAIGPDGTTIPISGALPYAQVKQTIDSLLN